MPPTPEGHYVNIVPLGGLEVGLEVGLENCIFLNVFMFFSPGTYPIASDSTFRANSRSRYANPSNMSQKTQIWVVFEKYGARVGVVDFFFSGFFCDHWGIVIFLQRNFFRPAKPAETSQKIRVSPRTLLKTCFWRPQKANIEKNAEFIAFWNFGTTHIFSKFWDHPGY